VVIYWIRFPSPEAFQVFLNDLQVAKNYRIIGILKHKFYIKYRTLNNINLKEAQICNIFIFLNLVLYNFVIKSRPITKLKQNIIGSRVFLT